MDYRKLYPEHSFAVLKSSPADKPIYVLMWKERNGNGLQSLAEVGTDAGTIFLYADDFNRLYTPITDEALILNLRTAIETMIEGRGGVYVIPNYKMSERGPWA